MNDRMRLILCMILGSGCSFLGIIKAFDLWLHVQSIRDLQELLCFLSGRICFERDELENILYEASCKGPRRYSTSCRILAEEIERFQGEQFSELWSSHWETVFHFPEQSQELDIWLRLGRQLGRGGPVQQKQIIDQCLRELDRLELQFYTDFRKKGKMYCSVGMCMGIFLCVLML